MSLIKKKKIEKKKKRKEPYLGLSQQPLPSFTSMFRRLVLILHG